MALSVSAIAFFALCFVANAWTGKVDDIYNIDQLNLHAEGITWHDGDFYAGSMSGQVIYRFDYNSDGDAITKPSKTSNAATGLGSQTFLSVCGSKSEDRIYGCFFSRDGSEEGGIAYWDNQLEHQKTFLYPNITQAGDCIVDDDEKTVYFTASISGMIVSCDLDLNSCDEYLSGGDLASTSDSPLQGYPLGVNGIEYFENDEGDFIVAGNYDMGYLLKVTVGADPVMSRVTVNDPSNLLSGTLVGVDGIVRVDSDVLVVVQATQMTLLQSTDDFVSAEVKKVVATSQIEPDGSSHAALIYGDRASKSDI